MTYQNKISAKHQVLVKSRAQCFIDAVEAELLSRPQVECHIEHLFTPGLYTREMCVPAGTELTSKLHKTEHQFIISKGKFSVFTERDKEVILEAPYRGITYPGTRRIIYAHVESIWTTIHPTTKTDLDEIEKDLIEEYDNELLSRKEIKE